jgi:lanthionine synthetase-like protein
VLYEPDAFEPLTETAWDEAGVRDAIAAIVADVEEAYRGPRLLWRAHEWDRWHATSPMKNLYVGAAGVVHALDSLRRRGLAETRLDLADVALQTLERFRERTDLQKGMKLPEPARSALLTGEAGILLVAWRLVPSEGLATELEAHVRANVANEAEEVMWGTPGTLLAARAMIEWSGDERWRALWQESAEALLARRDADGWWTQRLYGQRYHGLGPPHGLVGNVQALRPLLDERRRLELERQTATLLAATAVVEDVRANWPYRKRPELASPDGRIRLQWCAGAPGILSAASAYLDEELLLAGAELIWAAGAHGEEKGPAVCHGTAANGYALLKVFERTGDERWLERSRRFALHALEQAERRPRRFSLWTGDLGVALFAADCLAGAGGYPFFDSV